MNENIAGCFLELASEQRVGILLSLLDEKAKISTIAKKFDSSIQEVSRNFTRLQKADLIVKDNDGFYSLSTFGRLVCMLVPSLGFIAKNKKYFKEHDFGDVPLKFVQRLGALGNSKLIVGFTRVQDEWKRIYTDAEEYIYNILIDVSYSDEIIQLLAKKLSNKIKITSIFSENAIVSNERKEKIAKYNFEQFIKNELVKRKMKKDVKVVVVLNEHTACVCFPSISGETDLSKAFVSDDADFHEWCVDYFADSLENSRAFREDVLNKN